MGASRDRFYARKANLASAARGQANLRDRLQKPLAVLMGLAGVVLLIACVNLANLMLSRAAGRQHELAVRAALGAGVRRLTVQLLTESMLLSFGGAVLGFIVAIWTSRLLLSTAWTGAMALALEAKDHDRRCAADADGPGLRIPAGGTGTGADEAVGKLGAVRAVAAGEVSAGDASFLLQSRVSSPRFGDWGRGAYERGGFRTQVSF
jgi:hypothetical protein